MRRQARAPQTQPFGAEAFQAGGGTVLRWLGMAGFLINSRGTTLMIDPLLGGFDMPVMIEFPMTRRGSRPALLPRVSGVTWECVTPDRALDGRREPHQGGSDLRAPSS